jgi:hypothetical protein
MGIKVEGHESEQAEINGVQIKVTSYQIGERYFCHVTNIDPGATIARGEGSSRDEAREVALSKATSRLP